MFRPVPFAEGEYYHIYSRGVEKRDIFMDEGDRQRFQHMLFLANAEKPVVYRLVQSPSLYKEEVGDRLTDVGAYCMMSNHFHFLIKETREGGITEFMRKLLTGYTKYLNKKYDRVGPLFQSRFKAEHVNKDEYLKYLYAYIHLNPVKLIEPEWKEKGIKNLSAAKKYLEEYRFSSYEDYAVGNREESAILTPGEFPDYFEQPGDFAKFVEEWLDYKKEQIGEPAE